MEKPHEYCGFERRAESRRGLLRIRDREESGDGRDRIHPFWVCPRSHAGQPSGFYSCGPGRDPGTGQICGALARLTSPALGAGAVVARTADLLRLPRVLIYRPELFPAEGPRVLNAHFNCGRFAL